MNIEEIAKKRFPARKHFSVSADALKFMAYGRKTNLRTFALRCIAKFINTKLIEDEDR